jgi:hypothetical protein
VAKEEKTVNANQKTAYTPDLPFNKDLQEDDRVSVIIEWPTIEQFDLMVGRNEGTTVMFHRLTRECCVEITNFSVGGVPVKSGKELVEIRSRGAAKARNLSINIGSYIFEQSVLTESEEKN